MQLNNYKKIIFFIGVFALLFFTFYDISEAASVCKPDSCESGFVCVERDGLPACTRIGITIPNPSFGAPTATTTFSGFMCGITNFLSVSLVPPVAVLMTLVVGFLFLISMGDPTKLKTANKVLLFTVVGIVVVLLSPAIVGFISDIFNVSGDVLASCGGGAAANIISNAIINLINWLSWFIALAAVATGVYSGFLFMTASGDAEKLKKSWKTFVFAIVGIAVAIFAFSIISIVEMFF
jgi:hypothetical protein